MLVLPGFKLAGSSLKEGRVTAAKEEGIQYILSLFFPCIIVINLSLITYNIITTFAVQQILQEDNKDRAMSGHDVNQKYIVT